MVEALSSVDNKLGRRIGKSAGNGEQSPEEFRPRNWLHADTSAGEEVLLHDESPLYGPGTPPAFTPMMRTTGINIDRAGNVWAVNNWKPDFDIDVKDSPRGDGICIFVGLAKPPRREP